MIRIPYLLALGLLDHLFLCMKSVTSCKLSEVGVVWWIRISLDMEVKQMLGRN